MSNQAEIVERASDGTLIAVAAYDVYTHIVGGVAEYDELTHENGNTYRRYYTWADGSVTESSWVKQP